MYLLCVFLQHVMQCDTSRTLPHIVELRERHSRASVLVAVCILTLVIEMLCDQLHMYWA
jgi:hypothetical protein